MPIEILYWRAIGHKSLDYNPLNNALVDDARKQLRLSEDYLPLTWVRMRPDVATSPGDDIGRLHR
jgi:hypothetical protein